MLQNLELHYDFKRICNNWERYYFSLWILFPLHNFLLFEISASTSGGIGSLIVIRDLMKLFTSVSGARGRVKDAVLLGGLDFSVTALHANAYFCAHFAGWSPDAPSFLPSDVHHSASQSYLRSKWETWVPIKLADFPTVISPVKTSTFLLFSRSSLLWRIFLSLEELFSLLSIFRN